MKALVLQNASRLEYTEVPDPVPGPDELLVRIRAVGVCGSDVHGAAGQSGRRIPPIIMGHEAAGEVVRTASGGKFSTGDRVVIDSTWFCGTCETCRFGRINLCEYRRVLGVSCQEYRQHGAMAEYLAVPERMLHRIPHSVSYAIASLVEPMAVALHAIKRADVRTAPTEVIVVGAGTIGLLLVHLCKVRGVPHVVALDIDSHRLELARRMGADAVVNVQAGEPVVEVLKQTGGTPADVSFDAVGLERTVGVAVRCVKRGGVVVLVGNLTPESSIPLQVVVTNEISLYGSCAYSEEYAEVIDFLASGRVALDPLISVVAPLRDGSQWFRDLQGPHGHKLLKVVLEP